jgi:hypothetical protein
MKRMRGRHNRGGGGSGGGLRHQHHGGSIPLNRNHVFDSNGPDVRVRGTAQQLFEKYLQLGRDATGAGDRVTAESYFQHAEHYFRILNAMNQAAAAQQPHQQRRERTEQPDANGSEADEQPEVDDAAEPNGHAEPRQIPIAAGQPEG